MYGVGSRMCLTRLPLQSDCDVETPLYIMNGSHVNHHPNPSFAPRHVPPTAQTPCMYTHIRRPNRTLMGPEAHRRPENTSPYVLGNQNPNEKYPVWQ